MTMAVTITMKNRFLPVTTKVHKHNKSMVKHFTALAPEITYFISNCHKAETESTNTTMGECEDVQYIPRNMHTVFALLCFVMVIHWLIFPYPSGLLHWHCGNLTIAPVPAKQPWWIWINTSYEFIMNDCITTTKQSTTKPCAYFLGYTVQYKDKHKWWSSPTLPMYLVKQSTVSYLSWLFFDLKTCEMCDYQKHMTLHSVWYKSFLLAVTPLWRLTNKLAKTLHNKK